MMRSLLGLAAVVVGLALGAALFERGSDTLILTPTPLVEIVKSVPTSPVTTTTSGVTDGQIQEAVIRSLIPGSKHFWGDGIRSPTLE